MKKIYKIVGENFNETHHMGVLLKIKNLFSGEVIHKTPIDLFNDRLFLKKLRPADILRVGYIVGEYQMYLSYRFMSNKKQPFAH